MEQVDWRMAGEVGGRRRFLTQQGLSLAIYVVAALVVWHLHRSVGGFVGFAVLGAVSGYLSVRHQYVRLTDDGVEVRRIWKATYLWSEIAVVEPGPEWDDSRGRIRLVMHPGGPAAETETLPFPTTAGRAPDDTTVADAIRSIRRRLPAASGEY